LEFIPAKESRLFITFFYWYTSLLLRLRFRSVNVIQNYSPKNDVNTVYYLNHNYWWDALIPLYLNEKYFRQQARALMEDTQMLQYGFFSRIGAFSINLNNPKLSILSLRYALDSLRRLNSSVFIYPEGKIVPASEHCELFKDGLSWLYQKTESIDFVPIALNIDYSKASKPEFNIYIGKSVNPDKTLDRKELSNLFKEELDKIIVKARGMNHQVHS